MEPYSADDYAAQAAQLLPQGAAWTREPGSVLESLLQALAQEPARLDATAHRLLAELDPVQALALLPEWERVCGLPDTCTQGAETISQRRDAVVLKLTARGAQTPAYFAELATLLANAPCTIREYRPFRVGMSAVGDSLYNGDWPHAFTVQAPAVPVWTFCVGHSAVGETLRTWGNERLECGIRKEKPAHTIVTFTYGAE